MRASELIAQYNAERPNKVDDSLKLNWLKTVDQMIMNEVILTHEVDKDLADRFSDYITIEEENEDEMGIVPLIRDGEFVHRHHPRAEVDEEHWFDNWDMDFELIAETPYSDVYLFYLDQRIALMNNETGRYNTVSTLYNDAYVSFQAYWNRTHMPIQRRKPFLIHDIL